MTVNSVVRGKGEHPPDSEIIWKKGKRLLVSPAGSSCKK